MKIMSMWHEFFGGANNIGQQAMSAGSIAQDSYYPYNMNQQNYAQAMQGYRPNNTYEEIKEIERLDLLAKRKAKEIELIRTDEGTKELYENMIEAQEKYRMWIELKL